MSDKKEKEEKIVSKSNPFVGDDEYVVPTYKISKDEAAEIEALREIKGPEDVPVVEPMIPVENGQVVLPS